MTQNRCRTPSVLSADVLHVTDGFCSCFKAQLHWSIFHQARTESWWQVLLWSSAKEADAASHSWHCWQHFCVQQDSAPVQCAPHSWNSPAPWAGNTGFYLSRSVAANNPDLNPVDYRIWGPVQECVHKIHVCDTSDLKQRLIDTWAGISQNVNKAVGQCRKRLHACLKAKGHHFEHLLNQIGSFQRHNPTQSALQSHQQSTEENTLWFVSFTSQLSKSKWST